MTTAARRVMRTWMRGLPAGLASGVLALPWGVDARGGTPEPPRARVAPTELEAHGHVRVDPYCSLNRRDNPEVLAYLQAENECLERTMEGSRALRETLFEEMVSRIPKNDATVPYRLNGYDYDRRFEGEGG